MSSFLDINQHTIPQHTCRITMMETPPSPPPRRSPRRGKCADPHDYDGWFEWAKLETDQGDTAAMREVVSLCRVGKVCWGIRTMSDHLRTSDFCLAKLRSLRKPRATKSRCPMLTQRCQGVSRKSICEPTRTEMNSAGKRFSITTFQTIRMHRRVISRFWWK